MVAVGAEVIINEVWCEVPHMCFAYAKTALKRGGTAVTVYPYTGWDCIWPFLERGLRVYTYPIALLSKEDNRLLLRRWQAKARREYGLGMVRLAVWEKMPLHTIFGEPCNCCQERASRGQEG